MSNINNLNSRRKQVKNLQKFNCGRWPKSFFFFFFSLFQRKEAKAHLSCCIHRNHVSLTDTPMTKGEGTHGHFKRDSMPFPSPGRRTMESPFHTSTSVWIRKFLCNYKEIYHTCTGLQWDPLKAPSGSPYHHCRKCSVISAEEGKSCWADQSR